MAVGGEDQERVRRRLSLWTYVSRWLREDASITQWFDDTQEQILEDDRYADLPIWKAIMQYQGFDIKRIIRLMKTNSNAYVATQATETVKMEVTIDGVKREFKYTNKEAIMMDIEFIIYMFSERGSTNAKYTSKSTPALTKIAGWMVEKYGIDITINKPLSSLGPDVITVPRIVSCFPGKICEYFHRGFGNNLVTFTDLHLPEDQNLSRCLLCPHLTPLIPKELMRIENSFLRISFLVHLLVDNVLHKKAGNYTPLESILTYFKAEYNSNGTPEPGRAIFFSRMGLLNANETAIAQVILNQAEWAVGRIRALRPNDAKLEQTIQELARLE